MMQTGTFTFRDGVWQTVLRTVTVHMTVRLVPNAGKRPGSEAPDFHILAGGVKAGAAWRRDGRDLPPCRTAYRLNMSEQAGPQHADFFVNEAEGAGVLLLRYAAGDGAC